MKIARTIFALLLAFSVAILPLTGSTAALQVQSSEQMPAMDMGAEPMSDCCDKGPAPCDKQGKADCASRAACALKCFTFTGSVLSGVPFPVKTADELLAISENPAPSEAGVAPFRPPRV